MSLGNNVFSILYNLFFVLVDVGANIWNFLFTTLFEIPEFDIDIFGWQLQFNGLDVNLMGLLLTGGVIIMITLYLVKVFVPLT